jgi:hypothetical protein
MKYKINKGLINQTLAGKMTIFDGEKSTLYTFNETSSFIFGAIKSGKDSEIIKDLVTKRYKIDKKIAGQDFEELIEELLSKKIISILKH